MTKPMHIRKAAWIAALVPLLYLTDGSREASGGLTLVRDAQAVIGRPMTPMSVAGVARRTTYRAATANANAAAPAPQPAPVTQAVAPQPAAAPRPAGAPAAGAIVHALPAGCAPEVQDGIEYQKCGGVRYRSGFQGSNLVYVAQ